MERSEIRDGLAGYKSVVSIGPHVYLPAMLRIETEREDDGRWIAEVPALPGVMSYGATDAEARSKATALALRVVADRVENGEALPHELAGMFQTA
jgi:predicted RNase H-like HicB family nuclease